MYDLVKRGDVLDALIEKGQMSKRYKLGEYWELNLTEIKEAVESVPSEEPERKETMENFAVFSKVSRDQFMEDASKFSYIFLPNCYDDIKLPDRATEGSAGYDIFMPFSVTIRPEGTCTVPTGLKIQLPTDTFLMIVPRSSLGFKFQLGLANTVGIIDSDYFNNPDNEGHIMVRLVNNGKHPIHIEKGDAFCQGIILPFGKTIDDHPRGKRTGGIGSTNKE